MASVIKLSYHRRLFLMLFAFSWTIILCFIGFQYMREKQYKSQFLNAQLQLYNTHLLRSVENGVSYEEYIATQEQPFDELRISIIAHSGDVVYDNMLSLDYLDNHRLRPEVAGALKKGSAYHIGRLSASDGREYFYSATRGDRVVVRTAIPYSASLRELLQADWTFLGTMIAVSLAMSVLREQGVERLMASCVEMLSHRVSRCSYRIPLSESRTIALMHRDGKVLSTEYEGNDAIVEAILPREFAARIEQYRI